MPDPNPVSPNRWRFSCREASDFSLRVRRSREGKDQRALIYRAVRCARRQARADRRSRAVTKIATTLVNCRFSLKGRVWWTRRHYDCAADPSSASRGLRRSTSRPLCNANGTCPPWMVVERHARPSGYKTVIVRIRRSAAAARVNRDALSVFRRWTRVDPPSSRSFLARYRRRDRSGRLPA